MKVILKYMLSHFNLYCNDKDVTQIIMKLLIID